MTVPEIATELNVDAVLESSVLLFGDSVRIQVQLIDAFPRERHLWQDTYDRPYRDIPALHSQVALAVAEQIDITLTPRQLEDLADTSTVIPEVYEAVLIARHLLQTFAVDDVRRAIGYLERAIGIDSSYAPAYAWLATAHQSTGLWWGDAIPTEAYPRALEAVEQALRLDSTLALAHAILGRIRFEFLWDWAGAEASLRKAIELDSNYAYAHHGYANFLRAMGRVTDARPHILRATELDPLWPMNHIELWRTYETTGEAELAEAALARALDLAPAFAPGFFARAWRSAEGGRIDEAIEYLEHVSGLPNMDGVRAWLYVARGQEERGRLLLDSLKQRAKLDHPHIARVHAALGEVDEAFEWLERGYRERNSSMVWLKMLPVPLDPLRRLEPDPRFQDLLRRMGFSP
jgi:tetratricopeptide (TPR) repeat protein